MVNRIVHCVGQGAPWESCPNFKIPPIRIIFDRALPAAFSAGFYLIYPEMEGPMLLVPELSSFMESFKSISSKVWKTGFNITPFFNTVRKKIFIVYRHLSYWAFRNLSLSYVKSQKVLSSLWDDEYHLWQQRQRRTSGLKNLEVD